MFQKLRREDSTYIFLMSQGSIQRKLLEQVEK